MLFISEPLEAKQEKAFDYNIGSEGEKGASTGLQSRKRKLSEFKQCHESIEESDKVREDDSLKQGDSKPIMTMPNLL